VRSARGVRQEALGDVLPHVSGRLSAVRQKLSLEAFGFTGFPASTIPWWGPFNVFDSRLFLSEELDLKGLQKARAEGERVEAARWTYQDTRELVVLVSGSLYLRTLAEQSRVEVARAEADTAARCTSSRWTARRRAWCRRGRTARGGRTALPRAARDRRGDALEEGQAGLSRAIGLPLGQEIQLTDAMPRPCSRPSRSSRVSPWPSRSDPIGRRPRRACARRRAARQSARGEGCPA
jgi:hypothetical protein